METNCMKYQVLFSGRKKKKNKKKYHQFMSAEIAQRLIKVVVYKDLDKFFFFFFFFWIKKKTVVFSLHSSK